MWHQTTCHHTAVEVLFHYLPSNLAGDSMGKALIYNQQPNDWRDLKLTQRCAYSSSIWLCPNPKLWATAIPCVISIMCDLIFTLVMKWYSRSYTIILISCERMKKWCSPECTARVVICASHHTVGKCNTIWVGGDSRALTCSGDKMEEALIHIERQNDWRDPKLTYKSEDLPCTPIASNITLWATAFPNARSILFNLAFELVHWWYSRSYTFVEIRLSLRIFIFDTIRFINILLKRFRGAFRSIFIY